MPTPDDISAVLEQLARGPEFVRQLIYEVPAELRKRRPAAGVWSAHEHAVHLAAIYPLVVARLEQMLRDPSLPIEDYEPSRDDPDDALLKLDLDAEMDRFDRERAQLIERLKALTPEQWTIKVTHTGYSHYGVYIMFRHLALHDLYHAYRIEERLLRKEWA
ncbi:MAG: DinB family protein [Pirellulales bacterium]